MFEGVPGLPWRDLREVSNVPREAVRRSRVVVRLILAVAGWMSGYLRKPRLAGWGGVSISAGADRDADAIK